MFVMRGLEDGGSGWNNAWQYGGQNAGIQGCMDNGGGIRDWSDEKQRERGTATAARKQKYNPLAKTCFFCGLKAKLEG